MLILDAGRVDWRKRWEETAWIHLHGGNDVGVTVGLLLGRRSCTVGVVGLAIARVQTVCSGGGSSICLMKGLKGALLRWLLACVVFQDNKRVVTLRVLLMNGSHQSYIGRHCGIM